MEQLPGLPHVQSKGRIFILCSLILIVLLWGFMYVVEAHIQDRTYQNLRHLTSAKASLLDAKFEQFNVLYGKGTLDDNQFMLQEYIRSELQLEARLTLINATGRVLIDNQLSMVTVNELDNHAQRPEILAAQKNTIGMATRFSETTQEPMMYVAQSIRLYTGEDAYVRVSIPVVNQMAVINTLRLWAFGLFVFLVTVMFVTRKLEQYALAKLHNTHQYRLQEKAKETSKIFIELQSVTSMLGICQSIDEANSVAVDFIRRFFPDTHCQIEMGDTLGYDMQVDNCWAARKNAPHLNNLIDPVNSCSHLAVSSYTNEHDEPVYDFAKCLPIFAQGEILGRGTLFFKDAQQQMITKQYAAPLEFLFNNLGLTYIRLILSDKMREKAYTDSLTNIWNRRYFFERLEEWSQTEVQFTIMVIDVDHFKLVNDNLGHDTGDVALKRIARTINDSVKTGIDVVARLGGEEFGVLLKTNDKTQIEIVFQRILQQLSTKPLRDGRVITLSAGVAMHSADVEIDLLYKFADSALYHAKQTGRQKLCFYGEKTLQNLELAHSS